MEESEKLKSLRLFLPVFSRRKTIFFLEHSVKIGQVIKATLRRDFKYRLVRLEKRLGGES